MGTERVPLALLSAMAFRTSFVPATGGNTVHGMRTDERRCIENAAEFAGGSFGKQLVRVGPDKI
jgi:hypothetical protein